LSVPEALLKHICKTCDFSLRPALFLLPFFALILAGCYHTELLAPNRLSRYGDRDITIVLVDRRTFFFPAESYSIVRTEAGPVIHGTGKEYQGPDRSGARMFTGTIPVSSVKYVEIEKKTAFYYIIPAAFVCGMLLYLFVVRGGSFSG
jgi:hypothetical protein